MSDVEKPRDNSQIESPKKPSISGRRNFFKFTTLVAPSLLAAGQTGRYFGQQEGIEYQGQIPDTTSNLFDRRTFEQYKANDIVPLYNPQSIDSSTYSDSLDMYNDSRIKYSIKENTHIGNLGILKYSSEVRIGDFFIGPRHQTKNKGESTGLPEHIVGHMLNVAYNIPPDLEGKEISVTGSPYGRVLDELPEKFKIKLTNEDGNQKLIPMILPKGPSEEGMYLQYSKVFTLFDENNKEVEGNAVFTTWDLINREQPGCPPNNEAIKTGTVGWGIFKQVMVEDRVELVFQGYACDPSFKANVDFRNLPSELRKLYPNLHRRY